jgi:type IV secretory pathway TraG/TraD family ATPase VirD4
MKTFENVLNDAVHGNLTWAFEILTTFPFYVGLIAGVLIYFVFMLRESKVIYPLVIILLVQFIYPILFFSQGAIPLEWLNNKDHISIENIQYWCIGVGAGVSVFFIIWRYLSLFLNKLGSISTISSKLVNDRGSDIRELFKQNSSFKDYNPLSYFSRKMYFCGLMLKRIPLYLSKSLITTSHILLLGATGSGKSLFAALLLSQAMKFGDTVVVFDPKNDEFLLRVLSKIANSLGLPVTVIDLLGDKAQLCLYEDKTAQEHEELDCNEPPFQDRDSDGDFYNMIDRELIESFSRHYDQYKSLNYNFKTFLKNNPDCKKRAPKFYMHMQDLLRIAAINAMPGKGFPLKKGLGSGGLIFIKGAFRNPRIKKGTRMILLSIIQFIENRDRATARNVCIFCDEAGVTLNLASLQGAQTIRDKKGRFIYATQSLENLAGSEINLPPSSIKSAISENCRLTAAFEINSPDTADFLSRKSGTIRSDEESHVYETNASLSEIKLGSRTTRSTSRPLFDSNDFLALQKGQGILFGDGIAKRISVSPIKLTKKDVAPPATEFPDAQEIEDGFGDDGMGGLVDVD